MKLELEDKLKNVDQYKEGWRVVQIFNRFNIVKSGVRRIERQYKEHGISSFSLKVKSFVNYDYLELLYLL